MEEWREKLLSISEKIGKFILSVNEAMTKFVSSDAFAALVEFFSNIPDDIQETELFKRIAELEKAEISYDKIEWLQNEIGYMTYDLSVNTIKRKNENTELDKYVISIIDSTELHYREKLVVLLAHFEALVYQAMTYERKPNDKIKNIVSQSTQNTHEMEIESYKKILIGGIVFIVFSNTDKYSSEIDKRIPFRNNILHRGTINYTDDETKIAYETLVYFIAELTIIAEK